MNLQPIYLKQDLSPTKQAIIFIISFVANLSLKNIFYCCPASFDFVFFDLNLNACPFMNPKKSIVFLTLMFAVNTAFPCTTCNKNLQKGIFDSTFYPNLFTMLLAFIVLGLVVVVLSVLATKREKKRQAGQLQQFTFVPLISAATTLGIGLGGFIDGIFLHQILQWHEMLSNKIPPVTLLNKSVNMFWDGIFHAFCLVVVLVGIVLLLKLFFRKDIVITKSVFWGSMVLGWGLFNLIEGLIDHQILKLHNVREITANVPLWNYGFLIFAIILIVAGSVMIRKDSLTLAITAH